MDLNETEVDDDVGETLATFKKLALLMVKGTSLTAAGLEQLEHCPELSVLVTGNQRGGARLLSRLCKCTKLRGIDIVWNGRFSAADIGNFNKFPDTGYLYFEDIGDEEADHLRQCEHLTGLDIHSRRMTLDGVRSLMQMADLRHLKLDGREWGPELVDVLLESPTLETVKIRDRLWEWWEFEELLRARLKGQ